MGIAYNTSIVSDGLVFALDAGNTRCYSGSGNTSNALVGSKIGALTNGVGFTNSNNGSFTFDGTNDFMHENDVYEKMQKADGFVVFTPVNWYAPSSQVKAFFDRLVCINLTLDVKEAKKIMGGDIKNPKLTTAAELSGKYKDMLKNHYEGKVGAFFIHGDDGADDYKGRKLPLSLVESKHEKYVSPYDAIMPIVHQCRYSGIFIPENCIEGIVFGYGKPYSQNNKDVKTKEDLIDKAIGLVKNLVGEIRKRKE